MYVFILKQGEERAVQRNEQRLADLKELSNTIAPLHLRRIHPAKPAAVVALCDWTTDKVFEIATQKRKAKVKAEEDKYLQTLSVVLTPLYIVMMALYLLFRLQ